MRKSSKLSSAPSAHNPMVVPHGSVAENDEIADNRPQLSALVTNAIDAGVREIHVEQDAGICRIRQRHNGQLDETRIDSANLAIDLIAEIRGLNSTSDDPVYGENAFTQRFSIGLCSLECSYYPTISGHNVSIKIEAASQLPDTLDQTTLDTTQIQALRHLYSKHNAGITLVVGSEISLLQPLYYGLLGELNCVEKKIVSIEHKNVKKLARISQLSLANLPNAELITRLASQYADTTFIDWVCSINTAVMSNLFAHYQSATVFITAESCSQAVAQLSDSAVNEKQLATSLRNIVHLKSSRLVCPHCAHSYELNGQDMQWLENHPLSKHKAQTYTYATGCERCEFSGSRKSQPLLSCYTVDDHMRSAIESRSSTAITKASERIQGNHSVNRQHLQLVAQGKVSIEDYKSC